MIVISLVLSFILQQRDVLLLQVSNLPIFGVYLSLHSSVVELQLSRMLLVSSKIVVKQSDLHILLIDGPLLFLDQLVLRVTVEPVEKTHYNSILSKSLCSALLSCKHQFVHALFTDIIIIFSRVRGPIHPANSSG